jgi:hypothetical protein
MHEVRIPTGLFFEKSKYEARKIWKEVEESLNTLIKADPYYGKSFYVLVYLKQRPDGKQNRQAYLQPRIIRPVACPDTGLFRVIPKQERYEMIYWLPALEQMNAFRNGGAMAGEYVAGWIKAFDENRLSDPNDHDFSQEELLEILSGKPFGKSPADMDRSLKEAESRMKDYKMV